MHFCIFLVNDTVDTEENHFFEGDRRRRKERRRRMKIPGAGGFLMGPTNICSAKKSER